MENVPVYIKIDKYKELLKTIVMLENKLTRIDSVIDKIDKLKEEENTQLEKWKENLENVKEKVGKVNHALRQG